MDSIGKLVALLAVIAMVVAGLRLFARRRARADAPAARYHKAAALFTPAERSFLGVLGQAIGDEYRIFGKVRVADVVVVNDDIGHGARQGAFNRISGKHFDFVLCSKGDLSVVCAIELDDVSHQQRRRHERDAFLKDVCEQAGLPLLRIAAQRGYVALEIRTLILESLNRASAPARNTVPHTISPTTISSYQLGLDNELPNRRRARKQPVPRNCPECGAVMVLRKVRNGDSAGATFWGCSTHPDCLCVVPTEK